MTFIIRAATANDFKLLPKIELTAARAYADIDMLEIANSPPIPATDYHENASTQTVFVVETAEMKLIGFCILSQKDAQTYIREFSVDIAFARRGIGTALLKHIIHWASEKGSSDVLLTTFADVPFNGPFYSRFGFEAIDPGTDFPALARQLRSERDGLLGNYSRIAMRYRLGRNAF